MSLYNVAAYGLPDVRIPSLAGCRVAAHAFDRADEKGIRCDLNILRTFDPREWIVVEVETCMSAVSKVVARRRLTVEFDVVAVYLTTEKVLKTVWLNRHDDCHATLDKSRFERPSVTAKQKTPAVALVPMIDAIVPPTIVSHAPSSVEKLVVQPQRSVGPKLAPPLPPLPWRNRAVSGA